MYKCCIRLVQGGGRTVIMLYKVNTGRVEDV